MYCFHKFHLDQVCSDSPLFHWRVLHFSGVYFSSVAADLPQLAAAPSSSLPSSLVSEHHCTFLSLSVLLCFLWNSLPRCGLLHPFHKHVLCTRAQRGVCQVPHTSFLPLQELAQAPSALASEPHFNEVGFISKTQPPWRVTAETMLLLSSQGCLNSHRHRLWLIQVNILYKSWSFLYPSPGRAFASQNFLLLSSMV